MAKKILKAYPCTDVFSPWMWSPHPGEVGGLQEEGLLQEREGGGKDPWHRPGPCPLPWIFLTLSPHGSHLKFLKTPLLRDQGFQTPPWQERSTERAKGSTHTTQLCPLLPSRGDLYRPSSPKLLAWGQGLQRLSGERKWQWARFSGWGNSLVPAMDLSRILMWQGTCLKPGRAPSHWRSGRRRPAFSGTPTTTNQGVGGPSLPVSNGGDRRCTKKEGPSKIYREGPVSPMHPSATSSRSNGRSKLGCTGEPHPHFMAHLRTTGRAAWLCVCVTVMSPFTFFL